MCDRVSFGDLTHSSNLEVENRLFELRIELTFVRDTCENLSCQPLHQIFL